MRLIVLGILAITSACAAAQPETPPMHTNRLARETSPYLLQHAHNPVDWWPWGEEAFEEARRRNVPIFLSIGYSTCYWCHVMERESFEDEATAKVMNERFVCVKVDREERPDVDDLYMAATQALTGRGGWPMSVWLEPESLKPFYAGTYFPPEPRHGMPAFTDLLVGISDAWTNQNDDVLAQADSLAGAVAHQLQHNETPVIIGEDQISEAVSGLIGIYDQRYGGFAGAPKFPQPTYIEFLLTVRASADDETKKVIDTAVRTTLDALLAGGIRDHVGGGFHRYSVDQSWTVPHFEKMLYDQGQLLSVYAKAAAVYEDTEYQRTATEIADYLAREMTNDDGAFYSAQDAEVDGKEGLNYLWLPDEIQSALDEEDAKFALEVYGLAQGPNFRDPHHEDEPDRNVLRLADRPENIAAKLNLTPEAFHSRLDAINTKLLAARNQRKQPRLDDKVLTAWNGNAIAGLAILGGITGNSEHIAAADRAASAIDNLMRTPEGDLYRTARDGKAQIPAFFEDYAWLALAHIELHRALPDDTEHLARAIELADRADALFGDRETGGFYDTLEGQSDLFVRAQSVYDGAIPSATSTFLNALIDLFEITGEDRFAERAARGLARTSSHIHRSPVGHINSVRSLYRGLARDLPLAEAFASAGAVQPDQKDAQPGQQSVVEVFADTERLTLNKDEPATFRVRIVIDPKYHILAADPGPGAMESLIPLRVGLTGGSGVSVFADYPEGSPYAPTGLDMQLLVYSGETEFDIVLERSGEISGRPIVTVTYQACSDTECLEPVTVELDVAIDPG